jgi:hypothetical protein
MVNNPQAHSPASARHTIDSVASPRSKNARPIFHTALPHPPSFCKDCGVVISGGRNRCATCANSLNTSGLINAAEQGRIAAQSEQAQIRRAATQRRQAAARNRWRPSDLPAWLSEKVYLAQIQPRLKVITLSVLASKLRISIPYAVDVRSARRVPHPRHWQTLAQLVGFS